VSGRLISVADVVVDSRTAGREGNFTYEAPAGAKPGQAWLVPLGARSVLAFITQVRKVKEEDLGFPRSKLRPLGREINSLSLPAPTLALVHEVSQRTLCPLSVAMTPALPPRAQTRLTTTWQVRPGNPPRQLTLVEDEVWKTLQAGEITETKTKPLAAPLRKALQDLEAIGVASKYLDLTLPESKRRPTSWRLTIGDAEIEAFVRGPGRRKPAQSLLLLRLQGAGSTVFQDGELRSIGGVTDATLRALEQAGFLQQVGENTPTTTTSNVPNPEQAVAISAIQAAIAAHRPEGFLLYGVTGSGKTEVYLQAAAESLRQGRPVLYLVPEIALTAQVIAQLRGRFGDRVAVLHSNMTPAERLMAWRRVRAGECPVVLGARSALFAPLPDLGLIVLDEEHEPSYKQDSSPRYESRGLAAFLSQQHGCPYVLGSATPSIETFAAAQTGSITMLQLKQRARAVTLPTIEIEDLSVLYREKKVDIIGPQLAEALQDTLDRKLQSILFLNRRAYSPFLICKECQHRFLCPHCEVALAYSQQQQRLRCHHCDYHEPKPPRCPACGGTKLGGVGVGVERVQETVQAMFPKARVERLDRDVTRRVGALEEIVTKFHSGAIDILIGTQMVAKGFDFPRVVLVGVITADLSLNIPDFRAAERTFQLMTQVAGRAGRAEHAGRVIIQAIDADHRSLQSVRAHDYEGFFEEEVECRSRLGYPPYTRLVNIVLSGPDQGVVSERALMLQQTLVARLPGSQVYPALPCPLAKLKDQYRFHILIKLPLDADIEPIRLPSELAMSKDVRVAVDVDPMSLV